MSGLQYKKVDICHAESLMNIWGDADVIKYTNMKLPCTLENVIDRIKIFKPLEVFVVIENEELVGIIGCPLINYQEAEYGLFYQFCKSSWGRGNATAATKWLIEYMKNKYINAMLFADVVDDNIASEKILKKFGFELFCTENIERDEVKLRVNNYKL